MKADHIIALIYRNSMRGMVAALLIAAFFWQGQAAQAMSLATQPLATQSSAVPPNLLFVLDDSGSMNWDFIPDYISDSPGFCRANSGSFGYTVQCQLGDPPYMSANFNRMYYDPAVVYTVPIKADKTSKTAMNAANTSNWTAVPNDGYNKQFAGTKNLVTGYRDRVWSGGVNTGSSNAYLYPDATHTVVSNVNGPPYYFKIHPGLYCAEPALKNCIASTSPSGLYTYPATSVWCNSTALTNCQGKKTSTFKYVKYPWTGAANDGSMTITAISNPTTIDKTKLKVGPVPTALLASNVTISSTSVSLAATKLVAGIMANSVTSKYTATCGSPAGGTGTCTSGVVNIAATFPGAAYNGPVTAGPITSSGSITYTRTNLTNGANNVNPFERVDIVSTNNSYPKAASRTDCAGATCTYAEEMTNFANWYAYYRTRMQMMKSAASLAFRDVDDKYRVGYFTINKNNGSSDNLDIAAYDSTQKGKWYTTLFNALPNNSTPLREAVTKAGRIYGGLKPTGFTDPIQYSCQQNFTILSTDGYWNGVSGYKMDGTTAMDNQDGTLVRPYFDGTPATSNTLADVAAYFYNHDLRCPASGTGACATGYNFNNAINTAGIDVSANNVADPNDPKANWQHMTLFTLGLGIDGLMNFSPSYPIDTSGDYHDVLQGNTANSTTGICSWLSTGATCNWPIPAADQQSAVDDLWHAAVNGHGVYFSASNPTTVAASLSHALAVVQQATGSSAASATSSPNINSVDNFIFSSTYRTVSWDGELQAQTIDPTTGLIGVAKIDPVTGQSFQDTSPLWQVSTVLEDNVKYPKTAKFVDAATDARFIFTLDTSNSSSNPSTTAVPRCNYCKFLSWGNLSTSEKAFFSSKGSLLSQYATLPTTPTDQKAIVDSGANLVNYLRGQTQYQAIFRPREHVLGDTVNSVPAYVKIPPFNFIHDNYGTFKASNLTRKGTLYIGANDGMLHAINTTTYEDTSGGSVFLDPAGVSASRFIVGGQELWAYVPHMVMSNMYALADANYANHHQYYVDGSPQTMDVYDSTAGAWKTILVSGLGRGGKGYFAVDVTDPANPKGLWEFCNDSALCASSNIHMGYSYGNPVITRLADGTPVVLVTSGYENDDGNSYLYVLNAITGAVLQTVSVNGSGDTVASPGGLAKIRPFIVDGDKDNTAVYVYGGDLKGRLWKFTLPKTATKSAPGIAAPLLLASFTDGTTPQPITTRPDVGVVNMGGSDNRIVVYVGTGKYIETTDPTTTQTQSIYALVDNNAAYTDTRTQLSQRTITPTGAAAGVATTSGSLTSISTSSTDFTNIWNPTTNFGGWFADLPNSGERVNLDPQLVFGTLVVATNVPDPTASCGGSGGSSWLYQFRADTGLAVKPDSQATSPFGQQQTGITVGVVIFTLPSGKVEAVVTNASGIKTTQGIDASKGSPSKRGVWREILE